MGFRTLQISQERWRRRIRHLERVGHFAGRPALRHSGFGWRAPAQAVADCFEPDQTTLDIYLAVPHYRERGLNVATSARQGGARYRAEIELFRDENTGLSEKPVQIARKNLRLLAEGESLDGYSTLRVARVRRDATGTFQLDPRFVPPLLDFLSNDYLTVDRAPPGRNPDRALRGDCSGLRRQKNQTLADFTAADIANFWLLYTINTAFPTFRHLFETRGGHPEELYSAMLTLAGSLTTFSTNIHPRDLPAYDHDDLGACFTDLDEKLRICSRRSCRPTSSRCR